MGERGCFAADCLPHDPLAAPAPAPTALRASVAPTRDGNFELDVI